MKAYGINGSVALRYPDPWGPDSGEVQDGLLNGYRIRNKKQKRRYEKKRTRMANKQELRNTAYEY